MTTSAFKFLPGVRLLSPRNSSGFTVVELMVTVTLIAVSTALALPSYEDMIEKRRLTQGAEQVAAFLNVTQTEAMKRNEPVTISYKKSDPANWCFGTIAGDTPCDCEETNISEDLYCKVDNVPRLLTDANIHPFDFMHDMGGEGELIFDPIRGLMLDVDGDVISDGITFEVRSETEEYRLNIEIAATGQVKVCSKDLSHHLPGYELCSPDS
jgi:type IV fimbrial biogenesis protein FimT